MTLVLSPSEIVSKLEMNGELGLLGKAPNWNRRFLGELINVQNGAPFASDKFNREGTGMPLIRIRDVGASETSTYFDGEYDPAYVVRAGDLLVGMDGDFRCAKWTSGDALLNQRVCRLTVKSAELDERFLFLILQGYLEAIWKETSATTVKHLSSKSIQEIPIPLPAIKEQHEIVEILEGHLSRLDVALADVKQAKFKATQFRRSLLQAAFTGNMGSDGASPFTEWQTKTLGEIADTQLGKMLNKGKQSGKYSKPYLRTDNVHWGRFDLSEIKEMDILPEEQEKYLATKGDLLMCEGGASGRTAIWSEDYDISFQNHVHRIRPKNPQEISPKYLLYYFEWYIKNGYASDLIKGVTISSLSQSGLRSIEVTYPSLDEQRVIVGVLEDHLSRLEASASLADAMEKQSNGLRRSLLQAAFSGQLTKEVVSV